MGDADLEPPSLFGRRGRTSSPEPGPQPGPESDGEPRPLFADESTSVLPTTPPADRPERRAPFAVNAWVAVALTGAVVGLLVVGLTVGSLSLCETVQGTTSCGSGPGLTLLVAIFAAAVSVGGLLLRLLGIGEPVSTSFLAIGLVAVLVLLFLLSVVESWQMVIVIPLLSAAMFALSHWVTTVVAAEIE